MPEKITGKILIAEDHPMYRDSIVLLLSSLADPDNILTAGDFSSALSLAKETEDLSLITLDIKLPGTQGLDGLLTFRQAFRLCPIIVVSMYEMGANVRNVMDLGVNGFIAKSSSRDQMIDGVRRVLAGEIVVITDEPTSDVKLTARQLDVLRLLGEGKSNKEIARALDLSNTTVRDYLSELMHLLEASNRTQAVLEAQRRGLLLD